MVGNKRDEDSIAL